MRNPISPGGRRAALIATGLSASLLLAACGGGSSTGSSGSGGSAAASGEEVIVGLITKTDTNPFFVKMKEGAQQAAEQAGVAAAVASPASGRRQRVPGPGHREPDLRRAPRAS